MQPPYDFFLWGYIKDQVYVPPLHASIPELKVWIRTAIETITTDMLQTVWNELDYHVDVEIGVYVFFYLIEQHCKFLLHTLQVLYKCSIEHKNTYTPISSVLCMTSF